MFGTGVAYSIRGRFGIYGEIGMMPNIEYRTFATSSTSEGISSATANRNLLTVNAGPFVTRRSGFARPYAYGGAGVLRDDYSWSTRVITNPQLAMPQVFTVSNVVGPNTNNLRFNFQSGAGIRFYLGERQGIRLFGEANITFPGIEQLEQPTGATGYLPTGPRHRKTFGKLGLGYFIQWRGR
jgi:hypothetical protein